MICLHTKTPQSEPSNWKHRRKTLLNSNHFSHNFTWLSLLHRYILHKLCVFGLYLSWLLCLSVGFLEKWDQCVINALRGESYCSTPPTPPPRDRVPLLDTGPHERLKVQCNTIYYTYCLLCFMALSTAIARWLLAYFLWLKRTLTDAYHNKCKYVNFLILHSALNLSL